MLTPLACTVRNCSLPLTKRERRYICERGHSYDIARSGYVNLLQPQDRRSREPGDSKEAVAARASLLAAGVGRSLIDVVCEKASTLTLPRAPVVVDLGCGTGDAIASLGQRFLIAGIGIDLSSAAAEHAARRFPDHTWVVANADRRLPLLGASVDLMLSLHGRRNPAEAARVLRSDGELLIAVPGPDDLIELRSLVQGSGVERDRREALIEAHDALFEVVERRPVREMITLDREMLLNLLRGTYRGARLRAAERVASVDRMTVTLASELFVMKRS
ncbi:MAG TPA: methyltransferase domain-containing protein [Vicinamibacterales bacterium]|nr:methyltransferase domain-containing protein [Vicinamibacterales bacterium]